MSLDITRAAERDLREIRAHVARDDPQAAAALVRVVHGARLLLGGPLPVPRPRGRLARLDRRGAQK